MPDRGILGGFPRLEARLDYAAVAAKRFPSATDMCDTLRVYLLALEEHARAPADGMANGLRWLWMFNERPPTISALTTQK